MKEFERLRKQMEFIHEVDKIKYIIRKTRLFNSDRRENDAEHSWHLAIMATVLQEHANQPVNLLRVIKMLLIHDIVEIDAGDVFFFDKTQSHDNRQEEYDAANRIFGLLPEDQAEEFKSLWIEFEEQKSFDALFAKVMDRLEPMLQNASNQGGTWMEHDVHYDTVLESKLVIKDASTPLWVFAKQTLEEAIKKGILKRD